MANEVFIANLRAAFDADKARTGRTLLQFCTDVFGPDPAHYKWLRVMLSDGTRQKREGQANYDRLWKLHEALGLRWPALWTASEPDVLSRLGIALASQHGVFFSAEIQKFVGAMELAVDVLRRVEAIDSEAVPKVVYEYGHEQLGEQMMQHVGTHTVDEVVTAFMDLASKVEMPNG